jgi:hypothetical protein
MPEIGSVAKSVRQQLREFDTVALLLADDNLSYSAGTNNSVASGDIVKASRHWYEVAASDATDNHVTTAGDVKLYVLPSDGGWDIEAFGAVPGGTTDCKTAAQAAVDYAASLYAETGAFQTVVVPPGIWGFDLEWIMKSGVCVKNFGAVKYTGPDTRGHFIYWGGTEFASFDGGIVDCNSIGNTNGIAIGGSRENFNFFVKTTVLNCVSKTEGVSYLAGGGKAVTLQHGAFSGIVDVIAKDGSFGVSTEGISANAEDGERASRDINVRMVCENMTEAGWVGWGSTNGGVHGNDGYVRNNGLNLDLVLINCGKNSSNTGPVLLRNATNTRARIRVNNTSGSGRTLAILKGTHRFCDIEIDALVDDAQHVMDADADAAFSDTASSVGSKIRINLIVENSSPTGDVLTGSTSAIIHASDVKIGIAQRPSTIPNAFGFGAVDTTLLENTTRFEVVNLLGGSGGVVYGQTFVGSDLALYGDTNGRLRAVSGFRSSETDGDLVVMSSAATGGAGSAGAGNQYVQLTIDGVTYKVLHDGTV